MTTMDKPKCTLSSLGLSPVEAQRPYTDRVAGHQISFDLYSSLRPLGLVRLGVTEGFKEVVDYFKTPAGQTPPGFRVEYALSPGGCLLADLVRDISYDKNGQKRPSNILFSADSANPYEVESMKGLIANLTCNPAIIYNLFINDPKANVGGKYKSRDEVLRDIGDILGPGCDISVELNDPFGASEEQILEEAARFREMLSKYRVVIKVPHTGSVNAANVSELMTGDKRFARRYNQGGTADFYRGHNLALMLREHGYRVNFTLMFEPYQTALALQARPYFINSFVMFRKSQSAQMSGFIKAYEATGETFFVDLLRKYMVENDYLSSSEAQGDAFDAFTRAKQILASRGYDGPDGDGLDGIRHNLRMLRQANLPDTRLIICNFQGEYLYPYIDKLLAEGEFADMTDRVVITGGPELLAQFTTSPLVTQFHRRFMNAAAGAK